LSPHRIFTGYLLTVGFWLRLPISSSLLEICIDKDTRISFQKRSLFQERILGFLIYLGIFSEQN